jgi:glycosyltransferase involved in cell wall biosynthesis
MPTISVIMSVYNGEKYLNEAISSVLSQDFSDFEFIIIDDGSTDKSLEIIKSFNDERVKIISRENRGLIASLNQAISASTGEYIARMDADDICLPNRFSVQLKAFNNPEIAVVGSWATKINENGEELGLMSYPPSEHQKIKRFFIKHNPFIHSSMMIKKEVFDNVGVYDSKYKHAEDYELWSRMLHKFKAVNIPDPLIKYRINNSGVTKKYNLFMRYQGLRARLLGLIRLFL